MSDDQLQFARGNMRDNTLSFETINKQPYEPFVVVSISFVLPCFTLTTSICLSHTKLTVGKVQTKKREK